MRAINIKWDTDGDKNAFDALPQSIGIPKGMSYEDIEDYISDQTGFCHFGFDVAPDEGIAEIEAGALQAALPCGMEWSAFLLRSMEDAVDVCEAIYGEHAGRLDLLEGATFPCWALFWQDDDYVKGRCEGTLDAFLGQVSDAVRIIAAEAEKHA